MLFSRKSPQTRADQSSAVHNQRWGEIYVLGFYICGWRVLVLCFGAKGRGGSVGCRVLGRVRWWKRRKGFGEWEWGWGCGGSVGRGIVTSGRRYIDPQM